MTKHQDQKLHNIMIRLENLSESVVDILQKDKKYSNTLSIASSL